MTASGCTGERRDLRDELAAGGPHRPRGRRCDRARPQARRRGPDQPVLRGAPVVGRAVRPRRARGPRDLGARPVAAGPVQPPASGLGQPPPVRARGACSPAPPAAVTSSGMSGATATPTPARRSRPPSRAGSSATGDDRPAGAGRVLQGRGVRGGDRAGVRARRGVVDGSRSKPSRWPGDRIPTAATSSPRRRIEPGA